MKKQNTLTLKKVNLEEYFDMINSELFNNEVEKVPLELFKNKSKVGLTTSVGDKVESIKISTFYKMTEQQLIEILAHEMIHAYIVQQKIKDNGHHGSKFMKMMNDINKKNDKINIKPTEDASYYTVNNNIKKPIGVILFIYDDSTIDGIFIKNTIINNKKEIENFINDIQNYSETPNNIFNNYKSVSIEFYKCDNPELSKFKIKNKLNLRNLSLFEINDGILMKIKEGELINSIKIK